MMLIAIIFLQSRQLLLYPEGTRFTKKKHEAAVEFARSKNLPVLKHLLQPRTKGFQYLRQRIKVCKCERYEEK